MEIQEKPSKIYVYRETSSPTGEIITAAVMLVLAISTGIWLVYPNLNAAFSPDRTPKHLGNLLIYILVMVIFLWMVFRHWRAARDAMDLNSKNIEAQGEILEIWGKQGRLSNEFWIAYRYYGTYEGKTEVRKKRADELKPGDFVQVHLLARDPHIHYLSWENLESKATEES